MSVETSLILFESENLRATFRPAGGPSRPLVVTFDSLNFDLRLERSGFGEPWLQGMGYDAVHVVARQNRWYQFAEMGELFAAVRAQAAAYPWAATYGSSMGGYAAVRFAGRVGARTAIAISPQFSIDPARAGFDGRWAEHALGLTFPWEAPAAEDAALREAWVFYDPKDVDRLHVEAFAAAGYPVRPLPLRHAGHPCGAYLSESGLLVPAVIEMIEGRFDPNSFQAGVRDARRLSGQYHFTLSQLQPPHRVGTALALAERAVQLFPQSAPYLSLQARLLQTQGEIATAEGLHRQAVALVPGYPGYSLELAELLARTGRIREAGALARPLLDMPEVNAPSLRRAAVILLVGGDYEAAARAAREAHDRLPGSRAAVAVRYVLDWLVAHPWVGRPILDAARRALARRPQTFAPSVARRRRRRG